MVYMYLKHKLHVLVKLLVVILSASEKVKDGTHVVKSAAGHIRGIYESIHIKNLGSYRVLVFYGIPYAEAPIGRLRFKKPVPKARFLTEFDATAPGVACLRHDTGEHFTALSNDAQQSEDCLQLNIYVPQNKCDKQKAVMVWIHGGSFVTGNANMYDGGILGSVGDVIVVTVNYRLAECGFLSTGDSVVPGNMGLWDQHLALKWIHTNIEAFGGDRGRVTLFGESAGASSVVYQSFYPGNKGLFHRAIAQSGTMFDYWAFTDSKTALKYARKFAESAGCKQRDTNNLVKCMREIPSKEMQKLVFSASFWYFQTPVFDNDFVKDFPETILSGQSLKHEVIDMFDSVDLIVGYNNGDGLNELFYWADILESDLKANITLTRKACEEAIIPAYLKYIYENSKANIDLIIRGVIHEYTDWDDPELQKARKNKLLELINDLTYTTTLARAAILHSRANGKFSRRTKTYVYRLSVRPPEHLVFVLDSFDGPNVANHMDDIVFLFGKQINTEQGQKQLHTYKAMIKLWTNFAKTGNPTVDIVNTDINTTWPEFGESHSYLEIQRDRYEIKHGFKQRAVNFWTEVAAKVEDFTSKCQSNTALTLQNNDSLYMCQCYVILFLISLSGFIF